MTHTINISRFILQQESKHPESTGELSELLTLLALGVKMIRDLVAHAPFRGQMGMTGDTNVQGEQTHTLDERADGILVELLRSAGHFGVLLSEERETVIPATRNRDMAKYVVAFDPLDGSSNLTSNIPVGTIFGIWKKRDPKKAASEADFLQPGRNLVAAGYAIYGPRTTFVYSTGEGVHAFTLDASIGEFILTDECITTPQRGSTYSVNEGNTARWDPMMQEFVAAMKRPDPARGTPFAGRYVGSLVADFDRNLKKGGIFLYPGDKKNPQGKLRLLYELIPLAFIAHHAGGMAVDGTGADILDLQPQTIHERRPFLCGSSSEVNWFKEHLRNYSRGS